MVVSLSQLHLFHATVLPWETVEDGKSGGIS